MDNSSSEALKACLKCGSKPEKCAVLYSCSNQKCPQWNFGMPSSEWNKLNTRPTETSGLADAADYYITCLSELLAGKRRVDLDEAASSYYSAKKALTTTPQKVETSGFLTLAKDTTTPQQPAPQGLVEAVLEIKEAQKVVAEIYRKDPSRPNRTISSLEYTAFEDAIEHAVALASALGNETTTPQRSLVDEILKGYDKALQVPALLQPKERQPKSVYDVAGKLWGEAEAIYKKALSAQQGS